MPCHTGPGPRRSSLPCGPTPGQRGQTVLVGVVSHPTHAMSAAPTTTTVCSTTGESADAGYVASRARWASTASDRSQLANWLMALHRHAPAPGASWNLASTESATQTSLHPCPYTSRCYTICNNQSSMVSSMASSLILGFHPSIHASPSCSCSLCCWHDDGKTAPGHSSVRKFSN